MGKNYFTEEQQAQLRANPYIQKVSEKAITYTQEFREKFAEEYQSGRSPSNILREMGIDPKVLGKKRRDSIVARMHQYSIRLDGFKDARSQTSGRPATKSLSDAERISKLEQQVRYLKQENEFLKKIEFLDKQAEWKKKQKQDRKKNSKSSRK